MKMRRIIAVVLIVALIVSLIPISVFATSTLNFTVSPDKTEARSGDEITYTVKMSAVQNLAGIKFKIVIPEGLTFVSGQVVDGLQTLLNAAKAEFTPSTRVFIVGSSNYSSDSDTPLMTFKCSVDSETTGNKTIALDIDEDDIIDTEYDSIPVNYTDADSIVTITIPSTEISLNKTSTTLEEGEEEILTATKTPENSTDTLEWSSSNEEKATVNSEGKVTAVSEGNATITVTASSGKTASCDVTIIKAVCKHLNKSTVNAQSATCTVAGNNEYKMCDNCGKAFKIDGVTETTVEAETIQALGHDFTIPNSDNNQHWNECSRCHIAGTKYDHTGEGEYQKDATSHWKVCGCGVKVQEAEHTGNSPVKENINEATCTAEGSYDEVVYCSVCNYKMSTTHKTEEQKGHTPNEPVKENINEETCTTEGSYDEVVYCSICGEKISTTHKTVPAKGHTAGTPVNEHIVPATHLAEGSYDEVTYCTICGTEIKREQKKTDPIPHDVSESAWYSDETNHWKVCGCGTIVDTAAHIAGTPVRENIVPATCTTNGSHDEVTYCTICNAEISRTSKTDLATGHEEKEPVEENVKPATCTEDGNHDEVVYCSKCNAELSRNNKLDKAKGHTAKSSVKENIKDSTCTEKGSYDEVVYCSTCNEKLSTISKTIELKDHKPGTPVKENEIEATVDKEGSYDEVIYCSECKAELSRNKKTTPKFVYEILDGANSTHEEETTDTITIRANGKFEKFENIKVDDENVEKKYYTAKPGSTIVTLNADYLNTLKVGEHKITFIYDDGEVSTNFKIAEKEISKKTNETKEKNNSSTPKTGDESNMPLWIMGLVISGILFVIGLGCKIKRRK